uniref:IgGFc-binding protein-like n=1 Tax=Syphacia muris TaxID=451379 RepID=A0A0N5ADM5_9BILA
MANFWIQFFGSVALVIILSEASFRVHSDEDDDNDDVCPFPWQTFEQNILPSLSSCSDSTEEGVRCSPHDPVECSGRNPVCVLSKRSKTYRCCSDYPQDISNPPGAPEQVKPICPWGATSYDSPSVLLCDPSEKKPCPDGYSCEEASNAQMLATYNMHLCCKTTTLNSFENVFYETKVGINKLSANFSMPVFYVTSLSPSLIPHAPTSAISYVVLNEYTPSKGNLPEVRIGDHLSKLPYNFREPVFLKKVVLLNDQFPGYFHHVLVLYNPHGNPEAMNLYYNRPSTLSREVDLTIPAWDEGAFFRTTNRVLTIANDKTSTRQIRKLYIVLVFKTKRPLTRRHPITWQDFHANYTSFTEFLSTETGKFLGNPVAGTFFYVLLVVPAVVGQLPIPPPDRPDCTEGWQTTELSYVPTISLCSEYIGAGGVPCSPNAPNVCTGRNPFCAAEDGSGEFKCCSDIVQDSTEIDKLRPEEIKPICPNGAIPYKIPQVMLCDPSIVNICPYDYTCVEAANGHLLPEDGRSLCCKTSTLYSFGKVFLEIGLSPRIVPSAPISAVDYVTLNVHTTDTKNAPEIRTGDHFVLAPYKLLEPAYLKKVALFHEPTKSSYLHVIMFDPQSDTENMQLYYDRKAPKGKILDLEEPIPDGGFLSKLVTIHPSVTNPQQIRSNYRKLWVVLVFKTVEPLTRLYVGVSVDLNSKYKNVPEFLRSNTGRRLGTPIAGTYFYVS